MTERSIVLITGANTGIGYQAVLALLQSQKPYTILLGSRSSEKTKAAIDSLKREVPNTSSVISALVVDISDESIQAARKEIEDKWGRVDALVNNAGAEFDWEYKAGKITRRELLNKTFDVNVSGAYMMTDYFLPLLLNSSDPRLIFITSGQSSLKGFSEGTIRLPPHPPAGWPKNTPFDNTAYRVSKTALNMALLNLSRQLTNDNVKAWGLSPGLLKTGLGNVDPSIAEKWVLATPVSEGSSSRRFLKDVRIIMLEGL